MLNKLTSVLESGFDVLSAVGGKVGPLLMVTSDSALAVELAEAIALALAAPNQRGINSDSLSQLWLIVLRIIEHSLIALPNQIKVYPRRARKASSIQYG